jgi:hypothetical protein
LLHKDIKIFKVNHAVNVQANHFSFGGFGASPPSPAPSSPSASSSFLAVLLILRWLALSPTIAV